MGEGGSGGRESRDEFQRRPPKPVSSATASCFYLKVQTIFAPVYLLFLNWYFCELHHCGWFVCADSRLLARFILA